MADAEFKVTKTQKKKKKKAKEPPSGSVALLF